MHVGRTQKVTHYLGVFAVYNRSLNDLINGNAKQKTEVSMQLYL